MKTRNLSFGTSDPSFRSNIFRIGSKGGGASHLSWRDPHTQPVHRWLLLALVDLGELPQLQDVGLAAAGQNPLALAGNILVLLTEGLQVAGGGTACGTTGEHTTFSPALSLKTLMQFSLGVPTVQLSVGSN